MKKISAIVAGLALGTMTLLAAPAIAAWHYSFSATGAQFGNESVDLAFTVSTANAITAGNPIPPDTCSTSRPDLILCGANAHEFNGNNPNGFGINEDFLSFVYDNADNSGGGGYWFFFVDGAFTNTGVYNSIGSIDTGDGFVGSAAAGILTVTNDENRIPEPATLALFGAGVLGLAVARRRKSA